MDQNIVFDLLRQKYPGYIIERASTCESTMCVKRKVISGVKKKILGVFPIYEYSYKKVVICFKRIHLNYCEKNSNHSERIGVFIAVDDVNSVLYWRF